jgi:PTH2 family peptidyl-tRNA hydrolase
VNKLIYLANIAMLDQNQLIVGISVLLSFFVGYKYGLKIRKTDDEDEEENECTAKKSSSRAPPGNYKMVLIVRNDLKMGKGKIGAQCGHAAVGAFQQAMEKNRGIIQMWENSGCGKIALKVETERDLMNLRKGASVRGLNYYLVHDAGRTQIAAGSTTVLAIGPALTDEIDALTGHLKLL